MEIYQIVLFYFAGAITSLVISTIANRHMFNSKRSTVGIAPIQIVIILALFSWFGLLLTNIFVLVDFICMMSKSNVLKSFADYITAEDKVKK